MKRMQPRTRAHERPACANVFEDDAPPARRSGHRREFADPPVDRKTLQLCAQVRRALYLALPAGDVPGGETLRIESVQPAPDAHRLQVVLSLPASHEALAPAVHACLPRWAAALRTEVARSIHRKRTPTIVLRLQVRESEEP